MILFKITHLDQQWIKSLTEQILDYDQEFLQAYPSISIQEFPILLRELKQLNRIENLEDTWYYNLNRYQILLMQTKICQGEVYMAVLKNIVKDTAHYAVAYTADLAMFTLTDGTYFELIHQDAQATAKLRGITNYTITYPWKYNITEDFYTVAKDTLAEHNATLTGVTLIRYTSHKDFQPVHLTPLIPKILTEENTRNIDRELERFLYESRYEDDYYPSICDLPKSSLTDAVVTGRRAKNLLHWQLKYKDFKTVIFYVNKTIVGKISYKQFESSCVLLSIYLEERFRRCGYGKEILKYFFANMYRAHIDTIALNLYCEEQLKLIPYFTRLGFQVDKIIGKVDL